MKKCKFKLQLLSSTWSRESNELFDYESPDLSKQEITITSSGSVVRNKNEIAFLQRNLNETIVPINEVLLTVDCALSAFYLNINMNSTPLSKETAWLSLRHFQSRKFNNGYMLSVGDLIKFGRITLKVREIQVEGVSNNILDIYKEATKPIQLKDFKKHHKKKKKSCRVCYCDDEEIESPLVNPCGCAGELKYIHLSCLQHWLKSRSTLVTNSNENCIVYTFNQIECELCKKTFPDFVKIEGSYYKIWDFGEPKFKNFISIESLPMNGKKSVYTISFDKKNVIKVGRSHESDLRITDVTVSRFHAQISKVNNQYIFEDSNSKFGSLVYLHLTKVTIFNHLMLPIQIGRTYMQFQLSPELKIVDCFSCLFQRRKNSNEDYCLVNANEIITDGILSVKVQVDEDMNDNSIDEVEGEKTPIADYKDLCNIGDEHKIDEINTLNYISVEGGNKKANCSFHLGTTQTNAK